MDVVSMPVSGCLRIGRQARAREFDWPVLQIRNMSSCFRAVSKCFRMAGVLFPHWAPGADT